MLRNPRCNAWRLSPLTLVSWAVLAVGCTGSSSSGDPGDSAAASSDPQGALLLASARVALPPPGFSPADLPNPESQGAQNVGEFCTACHALPSPPTHSATDWPSVVRRMWLRMEEIDDSFGVPVPTGPQRLVMMEYLIENALQVRASSLPTGPGRDQFVATCSRCHELADPRQHSPEDWVAVARRMSGHIEQMLGDFLPPAEFQQIVLYLQAASAR